MNDRFDDLVNLDGLDSGEEARLRDVHELLVEAGPPPELPAGLATLPDGVGGAGPAVAEPIPLHATRRRLAGAFALAAALAAAVFGGYLLGNRDAGSGEALRVAAMGGSNAVATVRVGKPDSGGNYPVDFTVRGLPKQRGEFAYYEVFVIRDGKPVYPCAGFRVVGGTTRVQFSVPYEVKDTTEWIVTAVDRAHRWPGRTVMTMV